MRAPGSYILLLQLPAGYQGPVGRLGEVSLDPGLYVYIGSAQGPGGVGARVSRHLRVAASGGPRRWHIDYLLPHSKPLAVLTAYTRQAVESCLAGECRRRLEPGPPGFGSSDKPGDGTHLYKCPPAWCMEAVLECIKACCEA